MMPPNMHRFTISNTKLFPAFCILLALLPGNPVGLPAQTVEWVGGPSGDFSDGTQWDSGSPPDDTESALFQDAGEVVVGFTRNEDILSLDFEGVPDSGPPVVAPRLTFNLGTHTLEIDNTLDLDNATSETKTFVVNGGFLEVTATLGVNRQSFSSTMMVFRLENGANLTVTNQFAVSHNNNAGPGEMQVTDGSSMTVEDKVWLGRRGVNGVLTIEGAGSTFQANSDRETVVGGSRSGSIGRLNILDGGSYTSLADEFHIAKIAETEGTILVSGEDSLLSAAATILYIGGTDTGAGGTGAVTFELGSSGIVDGLHAWANDPGNDEVGTLTLDRSAGLTANDATFDPGSVLRFGLHETDQSADLLVNNLLDIDGATLEAFLSDGFVPSIGDQFYLASYDNLNGLFANPQGRVIIDDTYYFEIDYALNGGNFIGLTTIPEPGSMLLVLLAVGAGLLRRRQ